MTDQARKLLDKASRAILAAEALAQHGDADFAAGRAYYAMFYAASALLAEKGLHYRRHRGVHKAFAQHFVKTGLLDTQHHRHLLDAFDMRVLGDYGADAVVSAEQATAMIAQAREFPGAARRHLSPT